MTNKITLLFILLLGIDFSISAQTSPPSIDSKLFQNIKLRNLVPGMTGGRITDIAIHPQRKSTRYVATASGNVWKTTNAGTTWKPIFDKFGSYSIGVITLSPHNPDVIWLGTGENNSQRSVGFGDGVYKSEDGGKTWKNVGLKTSEHIGKIIVHPKDPNTVYVASQGPLWNSGGERGLYKTTDGGNSWERILHVSENTGISDLVMDHTDPNILYASSYQRRRHFGILVAGGPEGAIYKSTDGGESWQKLEAGLPKGDIGRIALAISPQKSNVVYALIGGPVRTGGFYRSEDKGKNWTKMSDYMVVDAQYYMELFPDPHQFDKLYSVDMRLQYTEDGGKTFKRMPERNKHVDNHEVVFDENDPDYLMVGCDGGIYETWDKGQHWNYTSNLPLTQFYRVGLDNDLPFYNVYGGTQDNNTIGGPSRTINRKGIRNSDWFYTLGGDGFQARIDPENPDIVYCMYQYAGIVRYDRKSGQRTDIQPQPDAGETPLRWNWDAPLIISPHKKERLYFAANRLFRSNDRGNTWEAISPDLTKQLDRNKMKVMDQVWSVDAVFKNVFTSPLSTIVSLDESVLQEGLLYVGTDDGLIQISEDSGLNWKKTQLPANIPETAYVGDLHASPTDVNVVYAVLNNHKYGDYQPYVLMSSDKGKSWEFISKNLPKSNFAWTILQDSVNSDLLFLGTEFGLFVSLNGGKDWIQYKAGIPTIPIRDLEIQKRENDLVAASFGRGFFILDDYDFLRHINPESLQEEALIFPVKDPWLFIPANPDGYAHGDNFYTTPNPEFGAVFTYHLQSDLKSAQQLRKEAEKKLLKNNQPVVYPDWEDLAKEESEYGPKIFFSIKDMEGNLIRRIEGKTQRGLYRITWNLRHKGIQSPYSGRSTIGPFVTPGKYQVELTKLEKGGIIKLGGPRTFEVKTLDNVTLPSSNPKAVLDFQIEVLDLQKSVYIANGIFESALEELLKIKEDLLQKASLNDEVLQNLFQIETTFRTLKTSLAGQSIITERSELIPPSITSRLNRITGDFWSTTGEPTNTHRQSFVIAKKEFDVLVKKYDEFKSQHLKPFRNQLTDLDIYSYTIGTEMLRESK